MRCVCGGPRRACCSARVHHRCGDEPVYRSTSAVPATARAVIDLRCRLVVDPDLTPGVAGLLRALVEVPRLAVVLGVGEGGGMVGPVGLS